MDKRRLKFITWGFVLLTAALVVKISQKRPWPLLRLGGQQGMENSHVRQRQRAEGILRAGAALP